MRRVTQADFDFSKGATYRKISPLSKEHVRIAGHAEKIVSHHSLGVETVNIALPGDYIVKTKLEGDGYIIKANRFFEIYEDDLEKQGFYRNKERRICLLTLEDISFMTPWNEEQNVSAGGVIVEAGPYIYGIDKFSFIKNYGRADDAREAAIFILVSDPLEIQLEKAMALGLINHIEDIQLRMKNSSLFDKE